ncbi:hypothetical protein CYMTET_34417 [Cymbomonas tetramitiformis]|uniref:Uncharacterized protein n=1 Tax=Cymbomonas tetramitiformis TaxID=36881 RepID=A0AAE0FB41_9CHLO|nr:hypothetical protein CYMTET_34417 [Cymbomonas tetramitiformis]
MSFEVSVKRNLSPHISVVDGAQAVTKADGIELISTEDNTQMVKLIRNVKGKLANIAQELELSLTRKRHSEAAKQVHLDMLNAIRGREQNSEPTRNTRASRISFLAASSDAGNLNDSPGGTPRLPLQGSSHDGNEVQEAGENTSDGSMTTSATEIMRVRENPVTGNRKMSSKLAQHQLKKQRITRPEGSSNLQHMWICNPVGEPSGESCEHAP